MNPAYDFCALPIYLLILLAVFVRKATKGTSNRIFIALNIVGLCATICDLGAVYCLRNLGKVEYAQFAAYFLSYIYLVLHVGTLYLYLFFLLSVTRTFYITRKWYIEIMTYLPFIALISLVLTNPLHNYFFSVTLSHGYQRGPLMWLAYAVCGYYAMLGASLLLFSKQFMSLKKILAFESIYIIAAIAAIAQYFYPSQLLELFATSIAFLFVAMVILRPEETTDSNVGLPSFKAYVSEIKKILLTRQPSQVLAISFINANKIRAYFGEEKYNANNISIADRIAGLAKKKKKNVEIYFENPGTLYLLIEDMEYDCTDDYKALVKHIRFEDKQKDGRVTSLTARAVIMRIPEDLNDLKSILALGHEFSRFLHEGQDIVNAPTITSLKSYQLEADMDEILARALANHSFEMFYQPIYSFKEKKFNSAEALIRLKDEKYGYVSPAIFIPAAEKRDLIKPIGDFVLAETFSFIASHDLKSLGLDYIEINLSVQQCVDPDLPDRILELTRYFNIDPSTVNFEITETMYEQDSELMERNVRNIAKMGYTFSLDDYGIGYSNVQRITKLPLKIIKIDKSLVDGINGQAGQSVLRNSVKMMKDVDKMVVVEGVETKPVLDQVQSMDVDFIQGYFFSKPIPKDDFLAFVKNGNADSEVAKA